MQTVILSFTAQGSHLALRLKELLKDAGHSCEAFVKSAYAEGACIRVEEPISAWTKKAFTAHDALIFIGAAGIAVRVIAPFVRDKFKDPAVLVMDEAGHFVIPILSGHVGGGNALALEIANLIGAQAVLTTASDVQGKSALDVFAHARNLLITDRVKAKDIAARIVHGQKLSLYIAPDLRAGLAADAKEALSDSFELSDDLPASQVVIDFCSQPEGAKALLLVPEKRLWLGIGCKRGTSAELIAQSLEDFMKKFRIHPASVAGLASIDLKAEEAGILELCRERGWPFKVFDGPQLMQVEGTFSSSAFVEARTGVDCVCERAACLAAGEASGALTVRKQKYPGVTLAAAVSKK